MRRARIADQHKKSGSLEPLFYIAFSEAITLRSQRPLLP